MEFWDKISRIRRSFYKSFIERTLFPGCFKFMYGLIGDNMGAIYIYTQYCLNRWVKCGQYTGNLPFTDYLPVVYGPLLYKCTPTCKRVLQRQTLSCILLSVCFHASCGILGQVKIFNARCKFKIVDTS